jgi:hypothetical protein
MSDSLDWDISVPLVTNVYVIIDLLLVLLFLSGALAVATLYWVGFDHLYSVLRLFVVADGFMIVLLLSVMSFVFLNRFQLIYHIDDEGVQVHVGEFESSINRLAWRVSSITQKHSFTGGRVYALTNEQQSTSWDSVTRYIVDEHRRVISLTDDLHTLMRIYCTPEVYGAVASALEIYIPEPEE